LLSRKTIILFFLLIGAPVIIYFLWPSDESRIQKLFRNGARAMEKRDLDIVMSKVSFNYRDEHGMSYLAIREMMKSVFQRTDHIKINYENLKINVKADKTATADMDVRIIAMIATDRGYILGDSTNPVHLQFTLGKERTKWLVTGTDGLPFAYSQ
jgi:hypothetical protein